MAHYEERLENDLAAIRKQVRVIGDLVEKALGDAARAVLELDRELATATILGDEPINRETRELDRLCHGFVARHLPSAGHLRFVSSVLRLSVILERIGDYAETMGRTACQLSTEPPPTVAQDIKMMAAGAHKLYDRALRAFDRRDSESARQIAAAARQLAPTFDKVFSDLIAEGEKGSRPVSDLFGLLATCSRLERVIHQTKNICEETIFVATGETKPAKCFDILFLDERNDGASQLAAHYATKAFPRGGTYQSAGWNPSAQVDARYVEFADQHGLDLSDATPTSFKSLPEQLSEFEIVVALDRRALEHLGKVPFHTVVVVWDIDPDADPEEVYKVVAPRFRELMETLRGEVD